jgi:HAD superfamily hydrolase (TIGR01490 family)
MKLTLFDLDGTLIPFDSDHSFGEFMVHIGWADADSFRQRNDAFFADYEAGRLDLPAYIEFATAAWRGRPQAEALAARQRFMQERVTPMLRPSALALVRAHQQAGDRVAIVTATNEFVTEPIADAFGVHDLIALQLERDRHGHVTGAIRGVPSYREGKVERIAQWLAAEGRDWDSFEGITVYSDSTNDLPLLERASEPVATNPTAALESIARDRGWRILRLFESQ